MAIERARRLRRASLAVIAASAVIAVCGRLERRAEARREARLQHALERQLLPGLHASQAALSIGEVDLMQQLDKRPELDGVVYLNRYGEVRWFRDPTTLTETLPEFSQKHPLPRAVIDAHAAGVPVAEPPDGKAGEALAVPLVRDGVVRGLVLLEGPPDRRESLTDWLESRPVVPPALRRVSGEFPSAYDRERSAQQHYLSGVIFYLRGDAKRSADEFRFALSLSPGFGEARAGLARAEARAR